MKYNHYSLLRVQNNINIIIHSRHREISVSIKMSVQLMLRRFYCAQNLPNIKFVEKGSCGIIQLDRPKALNAISGEMFK